MLSNLQENQSGEIREIFGVSLSGEALRPLFGSCEAFPQLRHPSRANPKRKFLDFDDLEVLLGSSTRSLHPQRQRLDQMGRSGTAEDLLRRNAAQCQAGGETDFYYDPHTKQYTGAASILKGWCGSIKRADKALHTDFQNSLNQGLRQKCVRKLDTLLFVNF